MFKRRYEVKAVFNDPDFGDFPTAKAKFWSKVSANLYWWNREQDRRGTENELVWHWIVIDKSKAIDITPKI